MTTEFECVLCYNDSNIEFDEFIFYTPVYNTCNYNDPVYIQKEDTKEYLTINTKTNEIYWETDCVDDLDTIDRWWYFILYNDKWYLVSYYWSFVKCNTESNNMEQMMSISKDCVYVDFGINDNFKETSVDLSKIKYNFLLLGLMMPFILYYKFFT